MTSKLPVVTEQERIEHEAHKAKHLPPADDVRVSLSADLLDEVVQALEDVHRLEHLPRVYVRRLIELIHKSRRKVN